MNYLYSEHKTFMLPWLPLKVRDSDSMWLSCRGRCSGMSGSIGTHIKKVEATFPIQQTGTGNPCSVSPQEIGVLCVTS